VAAVVVSVVHLLKGTYSGLKLLERRSVKQITAFLFAKGGHEDPGRLAANFGKSFKGSMLYGTGFTFDDSGASDDDTPGIPSPISTMKRLIAANPKNSEVISPCIGGEEVNSRPRHGHHRYVINFGERSEEECWREWPELMAIVERKVKPERLAQNREVRARFWWRFGETCPALYDAIRGRECVLFHAFTSKYVQFAILPNVFVFVAPHVIFPLSTVEFAVLQSGLHSHWTALFASTLKDDLRYSVSDCFDTHPFPRSGTGEPRDGGICAESRVGLGERGERYCQYRAELMVANNEGLTTTYNRFHDPAETSPGLLELRRLHGAMDKAVLDAYGWSDVPTACGFGLDYLDTEDDALLPDALQERIDSGDLFFWDAGDALDFQGQLEAHGAISGRRKLPWRYRWPDDVRDDVLARLLALNAERYAEEVAQGLHGKGGKKAAKAGGIAESKRRGRPAKASQVGETGGQLSEQMGLVL
jgi:hypothetical protein